MKKKVGDGDAIASVKKIVENDKYDKYEVCPRIDFPVPQFVLPIL